MQPPLPLARLPGPPQQLPTLTSNDAPSSQPLKPLPKGCAQGCREGSALLELQGQVGAPPLILSSLMGLGKAVLVVKALVPTAGRAWVCPLLYCRGIGGSPDPAAFQLLSCLSLWSSQCSKWKMRSWGACRPW